MAEFRPSSVPVIPNASRVRGRILRIRPAPSGKGSIWEVSVDDAQSIGTSPNFVQPYIAKTIPVYVHPELGGDFAEMEAIEARVAFRGDEHGGRFVLVEDDVRKL